MLELKHLRSAVPSDGGGADFERISGMRRVDLHVHTAASDGSLSPAEVVRRAAERGLSAIAVTDHDTTAGLAEAVEAGERYGVEVVPGVELSVDHEGEGIHILGYFIDPLSPVLRELLGWVVAERDERNEAIAAAMRSDGVPVTVEALRARHPGAVIGRPHFAEALAERGLADNIRDAFGSFLSRGMKYYRARAYIPMDRAFSAIRAAGGRAVFAHPFQYRYSEHELVALTQKLVGRGLDGVECVYSHYTPEQVEYLKGLAGYYGLCVTGGSDFHGAGKPEIELGGVAVPYELLEGLRAR